MRKKQLHTYSEIVSDTHAYLYHKRVMRVHCATRCIVSYTIHICVWLLLFSAVYSTFGRGKLRSVVFSVRQTVAKISIMVINNNNNTMEKKPDDMYVYIILLSYTYYNIVSLL